MDHEILYKLIIYKLFVFCKYICPRMKVIRKFLKYKALLRILKILSEC